MVVEVAEEEEEVCLSQYCSPCVVNGVNGKVVVIVVVAVAVVVVYK